MLKMVENFLILLGLMVGKLSNLTWFNGLNLERIEFLDRLKIA